MKLIVLAPGHFHAALLQKTMYPNVDATVHVYAEEGPDLADYLQKVASYNARAEAPTRWRMQVHAGADFLDRFSAERAGDVVVIAGNNLRKAEFITRAVAAGMHVLADKPMAIDGAGFESLQRAFADAKARGVLLYDIMTERHEITTILQKAFARDSRPVRGAAARLRAGAGRRQGERAPLFQAGVRRAGQATGVVLRRGATGRRPRRHHHPPGRSRAVGVFPRRDPRFRARHQDTWREALAHRHQSRAVRAGDPVADLSRFPAQGRAIRRQPAHVCQRGDRLPHQGCAREGFRALEFRGARRRERHALLGAARLEGESRDPAGAGRGLATRPVHRAGRDGGRGGGGTRARRCAAPGARDASRHRCRAHGRPLAGHRSGVLITSGTRPISRRSPENSSPAWKTERFPTGRCPA